MKMVAVKFGNAPLDILKVAGSSKSTESTSLVTIVNFSHHLLVHENDKELSEIKVKLEDLMLGIINMVNNKGIEKELRTLKDENSQG